ncbi:MAG: ferritin family protein [Deltaproteobacteria bacterium]|jgi:rubrerythrin|nr:ferritin family protein [Deltaproteobacteria bacterium]MCW9050132.1 ferritin family protein [Deltaproteobacteria bacterium]
MNIYEYAMKMELDGKAFYEKLAAETESEGLRKIFSELADDEQKHYDIFRQLKEQESVSSMADSTALEGARSLFADLQVNQSEQHLLKSNLDAYQYAMKAEKESAKLYQDAADKEKDEAVKNLLQKMAVEERKHLHILENIFDFVNAPNQSLVWAEFSNLNEF